MHPTRKGLVYGIAFTLPALIIFLMFTFYPFVSSLYYSFTEWDIVSKPKFIGLDNYRNLLEDKLFIRSAVNTLTICLFVVILQNPLSLLLGLVLNKPFRSSYFLRTAFYLPLIVSLVVVSVTWSNLLQYDGVFNELLIRLGAENLIQDWLGTTSSALSSIILIQLWYGTGYGAVIYLAGLQSIPHEVYESAQIDGAKGWSKFRFITFPLLMPSFTICTFLGMVGALKFFEMPYIMTNGGPGDATSTLALVIYNFAFKNNTFGYATAAGILFMIAISIVTAFQLKLTRSKEVEY
ncbi:sugar ABC transporter permease [Cohnella endophytica]|uniref:Sugar ABC transporter permease n=1 Tax=Cohnella endophytica TaxID=2419778 RepID=A0A494X538_9BACL|nr:sugar ABC transporter permease [Cohnella endophytica]RKP44791.1 sugar ABC transporter permease [Cohnella endophytica]